MMGPKIWHDTAFAESFAEGGNIARVTSIQSTDGGFQVTIENTVVAWPLTRLHMMGLLWQVKRRVQAYLLWTTGDTSNPNVENVGKMLRLFDECTDNEAIMFICRFEIVEGKIEEFKHHAHQAMKDIESTERDTLSFNIHMMTLIHAIL